MSPEAIAVFTLFVVRVAIPITVLFILGALFAARSRSTSAR
jgi:hypothetical protein